MDLIIYIYFSLSLISFILFFKMNKDKVKTKKYRLCIFYFYFMGVFSGHIMLSLKSGELPPYLSLMFFSIFILIANIIFIGKRE